jgi:hypothetical protein
MNWIQMPEWNTNTIYAYSFYIGLTIIAFVSESTGKFNLPYSKFAKNKGMDPRLGMFIIYFLPILCYILTWTSNHSPNSIYHLVLLFAFVFHFGKRCLEVLFLHKFSGKIGTVGVVFITFAYSNIGLLLGTIQNKVTSLEAGQNAPLLVLGFGFIVFLIGEGYNFYHHLLLSRLRKNSDDKEYKIPEGGLFPYLVCPHYFFELLAWVGLAIMSMYLDVYMIVFIMIGYLSGRSNQTREWYLNRIPTFPKYRKRILPFLY